MVRHTKKKPTKKKSIKRRKGGMSYSRGLRGPIGLRTLSQRIHNTSSMQSIAVVEYIESIKTNVAGWIESIKKIPLFEKAIHLLELNETSIKNIIDTKTITNIMTNGIPVSLLTNETIKNVRRIFKGNETEMIQILSITNSTNLSNLTNPPLVNDKPNHASDNSRDTIIMVCVIAFFVCFFLCCTSGWFSGDNEDKTNYVIAREIARGTVTIPEAATIIFPSRRTKLDSEQEEEFGL